MHEQSPESLRPTYRQIRFAGDALMYEYPAKFSRLKRMTIPVIWENLFMLLVSWSDSLLAGRFLVENKYLAAVTISSQLFLFVTAVAGLISVGAGGMVSRRVGADQKGKASEVLTQAMMLSFGFGLLLMVVLLLFAGNLVKLIRLSADAQPLAEQYIKMVAVVIPLITMQHTTCACLRSAGQAWTAFRISLISYIVTIATSWTLAILFQDQPNWCWRAIPIGTVVGFGFSGTLAIGWLLYGVGPLQLPASPPKPDIRRFEQILSGGLPGGSIWVIINAGTLWHMSIVATLGDAAMAAHGVVLRLETLCWVLGRSLSATAGSLSGQCLGAERPDLATSYGWMATITGIITMTLIAALVWLCGPWLVALFIKSSNLEANRLALQMLPFVVVAQPGLAATLILTTAMVNGASDTRWPLYYTFCGAVVIRVVLGEVLMDRLLGLGLRGAWLAIVIDYWFRGACAAGRFQFGNWQAKKF